jgi:hypothetical protein
MLAAALAEYSTKAVCLHLLLPSFFKRYLHCKHLIMGSPPRKVSLRGAVLNIMAALVAGEGSRLPTFRSG